MNASNPATAPNDLPAPKAKSQRRGLWIILGCVVLVLLGWSGIKVYRAYGAYESRVNADTEPGWVLFPPYKDGLMTQNITRWVTTGAYGDERAYEALREATAILREKYPDARVAYMDASRAKKGKLRFHKSHNNGLNIDVLYFGRAAPFSRRYPSRPMLFTLGYALRYGEDRRCLNLTWDAERNWAWLMALRRQKSAAIEMIFVERFMWEWYLEEGRRQAASAAELDWAQGHLKNAGTGPPHTDHWHIRFL